MRNFKYKIQLKFYRLLKKLTLAFKVGLAIIVLFFLVLFLLIKPPNVINNYFANHFDYSRDESYMTEEEFITLLTPLAKKVEKTHGTRPSLLIAQAALESNWGNSILSKRSNNYFGIKGAVGTEYVTKEYYENEWEEVRASFTHYDSIGESVEDYANLLRDGTSWDSDFYIEVIKATNYQEAAYAIQEAGYATDPTYAKKLINIIEQYHLYEIDH